MTAQQCEALLVAARKAVAAHRKVVRVGLGREPGDETETEAARAQAIWDIEALLETIDG